MTATADFESTISVNNQIQETGTTDYSGDTLYVTVAGTLTDTIQYVATDSNGLTATSTRTVLIESAANAATASPTEASSTSSSTVQATSTATTTNATSTAQ